MELKNNFTVSNVTSVPVFPFHFLCMDQLFCSVPEQQNGSCSLFLLQTTNLATNREIQAVRTWEMLASRKRRLWVPSLH